MLKRLKRGCIQVYTGKGKGKTTAALGLALRGWGQGLRVCIVQFMKKSVNSGEYKAGRKLGKRFVIKQFGGSRFIKDKPSLNDRKLAERGLDFARKTIQSGKFDLIILDEINCALRWKIIKDSEVKDLLGTKPSGTELIFTGRYAPRWLLKQAHLITEMREKKHYFHDKIGARCGIEY